jgi:hypothetical protein
MFVESRVGSSVEERIVLLSVGVEVGIPVATAMVGGVVGAIIGNWSRMGIGMSVRISGITGRSVGKGIKVMGKKSSPSSFGSCSGGGSACGGKVRIPGSSTGNSANVPSPGTNSGGKVPKLESRSSGICPKSWRFRLFLLAKRENFKAANIFSNMEIVAAFDVLMHAERSNKASINVFFNTGKCSISLVCPSFVCSSLNADILLSTFRFP